MRDKEVERIRQKRVEEIMKTTDQKTVFSEPIELKDGSFREIIQKHSLVVVDCWAAWCGPCRMVAPVIEELARDYAGKILFGKLNVDENRWVASQYQITSIPTLLVFKNGSLVDRIVGAMPRQILEPKIIPHL